MTAISSYGRPETRERILDAAWRMLEARGVGITMAEIAREADVSRQAVYLHFTDRTGLFVELIDHVNQRIDLADLLQSVREAPTGRAALERMIAAHASYHGRVAGLARLFDTARRFDPEVAAAWKLQMSRRLEDHRSVIRRIAEDGDLAPGWDVESAAVYFYTTTLHWVWDELITEGGWSIDEARAHLTRSLERALLN